MKKQSHNLLADTIGRMFRPARDEPVLIHFIDYPALLKPMTMDKEQLDRYNEHMKNIKCPICEYISTKKG